MLKHKPLSLNNPSPPGDGQAEEGADPKSVGISIGQIVPEESEEPGIDGETDGLHPTDGRQTGLQIASVGQDQPGQEADDETVSDGNDHSETAIVEDDGLQRESNGEAAQPIVGDPQTELDEVWKRGESPQSVHEDDNSGKETGATLPDTLSLGPLSDDRSPELPDKVDRDRAFVDRIRSFNRFISQKMGLLEEGYSRSNLSLAEARILYELFQNPQVSARDLCKSLCLDPGYVSRILRKFEQTGLIIREKLQTDRRRSTLQPTEKGRALYLAIEEKTRESISLEIGDVQGLQREKAEAAMATLESLYSGDRGFPGPVFVRSLTHGDIGWVVQAHGTLYAAEYGFDLSFEALVSEIVAEFVKTYDANSDNAWIAESNGERVGCVFLVREADNIAKLRLLLVDPSVRGIGLGEQLVRSCVQFAKQSGYHKIRLWTQNNLYAARAIYQKTGFRCIRKDENHLFGQSLISETWELDLSNGH